MVEMTAETNNSQQIPKKIEDYLKKLEENLEFFVERQMIIENVRSNLITTTNKLMFDANISQDEAVVRLLNSREKPEMLAKTILENLKIKTIKKPK